jgi:antitoxin component of RelBE/YafQ-DinJ toxin-antitoxin module
MEKDMAPAQDKLTVSIDSDVRTRAEAFFLAHGFTMSTGVNALLRDAVGRGEMPTGGAAAADRPRRASTIEELKQMKADFEAGRIEAATWEDVKLEIDSIQNIGCSPRQ